MEFINFYLIPGLVLGCVYALGAVGITLIFGILRFAHLAHGDMATFGAFSALAVVQTTGVPPMIALPAAMVTGAAVAVGIDRAFYQRLRLRPTLVTVIASFGIALMLRSAVQVIWGVDPISYVKGIERPENYFGFLLKDRELAIFAGTVILIGGLHLFLNKTRLGKAMRAMSDNATLAQFSGIDTGLVITLTWIVAGALAAAAGVFLGTANKVDAMMGWSSLLPMFAAAILGGVGNPMGAAVGGIIIGCAEELSSYPIFGTGPLLSPAYKTAVAFAILVALLVWRPTGLFRGKVL